MKEGSVNSLLSIAGPALAASHPTLSEELQLLAPTTVADISQMLSMRNGFYAFESALHVFPSNSYKDEIGLNDWNSATLWRQEYPGPGDDLLFFAEDAFGVQFCAKDDQIFTFDPENGAIEYCAKNIEDWAALILRDFNVLTGYPLMHDWQEINGRIPAGKRLLPKIPFVLGGEFTLENLYLCDAVEGMIFRADIAKQIQHLPDGSNIEFRIDE